MSRNRHEGKRRNRRRRHTALTAFCVALVAIMLGLCAYIAVYYIDLGRIRAAGRRYDGLYTPTETTGAIEAQTVVAAATAASTTKPAVSSTPTATPTAKPTLSSTPTATPTVKPTTVPKSTAAPTEKPTAVATVAADDVLSNTPTASPAPTDTPTSAPTDTPTPVPTDAPPPAAERVRPGDDMPVAIDVPIPTPNEDTLVLALPTAPPVQSSFDALLAVNPDTVGFLDIESMLSLPVVQRQDDNEYYLDHSFEGEPAREGALFMDSLNRLVPEDDCLIVYGHNMKNRTMFGQLSAYADVSYMQRHPVVRFDTLYDNRSYVVFAAFSASMDPDNRGYFDVRNVIFDEEGFDRFVLKLQSRSKYAVPVDVRYGDGILLLVTCDYAAREGRFILALRRLRADETESWAWAQAMQAKAK